MKNQGNSRMRRNGRHAFSLGRKLTAAFITVSLLVGVIAGVAYVFLNRLDHNYTGLLQQNTAALDQVAKLEMETQRQNSLLFGYIVEPSSGKEQQLTEANAQLSALIGEIVSFRRGRERGGCLLAVGVQRHVCPPVGEGPGLRPFRQAGSGESGSFDVGDPDVGYDD